MTSILLIDDEPNILRSLGTFLRQLGYEVSTAANSVSARKEVSLGQPDAIVLDLRLGADDGFDLLTELKKTAPRSPIIMISGHADVAKAVRAIRAGAWDFLEKPINPDRLETVIQNALREKQLQNEVLVLRERWKAQNLFHGRSPSFAACLSTIEQTAGSGLTILLYGANGTGKEVLARYAHLCGDRTNRPFVAVNCATISRDLAESQLFGHRKGAFTGADSEHRGFFAQADGGTLFLDEIGELPLELQAKLLRAIENGEIQALGSQAMTKVSIRLIVASNRDLPGLVSGGVFRQDLFFRINQISVSIPSLEQRREDIPDLVDFLVRGMGLDGQVFGPDAVDYLSARLWPGNVRELKNLLQKLVVLCHERPIGAGEVRLFDAPLRQETNARDVDTNPVSNGAEAELWNEALPLSVARQRLEKRYLETQLAAHDWSVKQTAAALSVLPNNLSRRLSELDIKIERQS